MQTSKAKDQFITAKRVKGLSPRTLETYCYRLEIFARAHPNLPTKAQVIEDFLATTGPTIETRETYYRLLRGFYNVLVRKKLIKANPVLQIEQPVLRRKVAPSHSAPEIARLLNYPSHSAQLRAYLYLLVDTGMRLSEALSVTREKIQDVTITGLGKTGERETPISPLVRNMVLEALPWPWSSYSAASHAVRKAFRRAGMSGPKACAKTLRHSFVRLWRGDDPSVVGIMGWTSMAMLKVYRPYNLERAMEQHQQHTPLRLVRKASAKQLALL